MKRLAHRGLVLTALGLGTAAEDGFALLLTEEQPDGTLDFTLRFCEGWGETGDHYAEDSLSAVSASGAFPNTRSFCTACPILRTRRSCPSRPGRGPLRSSRASACPSGATFYGSGEPFYGDNAGMSISEEEGGVISFFSAGVGVIFRLDAQLRVASIERYEVA